MREHMLSKMDFSSIPFSPTTFYQTQVLIFVCGEGPMLSTNCKWEAIGIFHEVWRSRWRHLRTVKKQHKYHHYIQIFSTIPDIKPRNLTQILWNYTDFHVISDTKPLNLTQIKPFTADFSCYTWHNTHKLDTNSLIVSILKSIHQNLNKWKLDHKHTQSSPTW